MLYFGNETTSWKYSSQWWAGTTMLYFSDETTSWKYSSQWWAGTTVQDAHKIFLMIFKLLLYMMINSWPFISSCSNSVLMVYDLQLFLHRAILPKEKSCLELKKSWNSWQCFFFILSSECGEVVEVGGTAVNKLYSSWFSAVIETRDIIVCFTVRQR